MHAPYRLAVGAGLCLIFLGLLSPLQAADWPAWRYDARRSGATSETLAPELYFQWQGHLPRLKPAWPDQPKMQMDTHYEPIILGKLLIFGSSWDDTVKAYDTDTCGEVWRFHAEGPIRYAPFGWENKVYFTSDDGYLYCLDAKKGTLLWKHRGGPSDRKILGNDRLISTWPARGAPVIADGTVYYAAGIWPFMGIFIHALDARTGKVIWTNDGDGSIYVKQPHNSDSFAGVAPQGPLVISEDKLLIPGGRSVPACYDRKTGKLLYYELAKNGKRGGGSAVAATDKLLFNNGALFDLKTEQHFTNVGNPLTFTKERLYVARGNKCVALDLVKARVETKTVKDRKGKKKKVTQWVAESLGSVDTIPITAMLKTGNHIYVGGKDRIVAFDLPLGKAKKPVWETNLDGSTVKSLLAGDGKLFAVTLEGRFYCFGPNKNPPKLYHTPPNEIPTPTKKGLKKVNEILAATKVTNGNVLLVGADDPLLVRQLGQRPGFRVVVVEPDAKSAHALRGKLCLEGFSAERVTVLNTDLASVELPPYFASLVVMEDAPKGRIARKMFQSLRPYGGVACFAIPDKERAAFRAMIQTAKLTNAKVQQKGDWTLLSREGALPGSANWTHENGDAQNTRVSKDKLVKAPFGILWFGGSSHDAILPRHGHGPAPQVVNGRIFIEGVDIIRSMDVYTGRVLWEAKLPGVGVFYDKTAHEAGANATNGNYVSTPEGIYVAYKECCVVLDPATGKKLKTFTLPKRAGEQALPRWGYVGVYKDYLIGGADPLVPPKGTKLTRATNDTSSSSMEIVVMNRHNGKVLWSLEAKQGFRHNAICCGNDVLYCIDRLSGPQLDRLKRRGKKPEHPYRLLALDVRTGKVLWQTEKEVFGTWLSYSEKHDVLVEAGRAARDSLGDEPVGMRAYRGKSGAAIWFDKSLRGPTMIRGDAILLAGKACSLMTGKPWMRDDPLTGKQVPWTWTRNYGCNTAAASEHLLTFRSGAAGYFDLCNDSGTGNFGGFRSSCTNNLIVADGVLCAPDYTRTCSCSYQNQTSLALIHLPEAEMWTFYGASQSSGAIKRVGLNFAAPGDRKADNGTFWIEHPSVAGRSPTLSVEISPKSFGKIRRHSSQIQGAGMSWVTSSAITGATSIKIQLDKDAKEEKRYTVKLYFAELEDVSAGARVFDVGLQGQTKIRGLDVVKESGGVRRGLVKELRNVSVKDALTITLVPVKSARIQSPLLSGVEICEQ